MQTQKDNKNEQNSKDLRLELGWADIDDLCESDEEPEDNPESTPEVEDKKEIEENAVERRSYRGRGGRRGKRHRRGNQVKYEVRSTRTKSLRELVPAKPGEITNINPGISTGTFYLCLRND